MITSIETCIFQRKKGAVKEIGLLLNEGDFRIIDGNGNRVFKIWSFNQIPGIALHDLKIGGIYPSKEPIKMTR